MSTLCFARSIFGTIALSWLGLGLVGCGPQFDPPSKLQSLRILAVKKDDPYLRPASNAVDATTNAPADSAVPDSVAHLTLALEDARPAERRQGPLQKLWFGGCNNPPRDNYFTCLLNVWLSFKVWSELGPLTARGSGNLPEGEGWPNQEDLDQIGPIRLMQFLRDTFPGEFDSLAAGAPAPAGSSAGQQELLQQAMALRVGTGDTFDYAVPPWVIEQHAPPDDPDLPRYGLSQAFLAVCDGELGISPDWETVDDPLAILTDATRGFPLTCYERGTKKERGPDHYMVSYSNVYVYDELTNQNPVIDGFRFGDADIPLSALCIGEACQNAPDPPCLKALKVNACDPDREAGCKDYRISPILSESKNSERDPIASSVGGGDAKLREQMWIRYYSDLGKVKRDIKRLQDATDGWYSDHHTEWTPPKQGSGVARIWSVVYDNRGGVEWVRLSVCVD